MIINLHAIDGCESARLATSVSSEQQVSVVCQAKLNRACLEKARLQNLAQRHTLCTPEETPIPTCCEMTTRSLGFGE